MWREWKCEATTARDWSITYLKDAQMTGVGALGIILSKPLDGLHGADLLLTVMMQMDGMCAGSPRTGRATGIGFFGLK